MNRLDIPCRGIRHGSDSGPGDTRGCVLSDRGLGARDGNGRQTRSSGIAGNSELRGEAFNLVPDEAPTVIELVRTVLSVVGTPLQPEILQPDAPFEEEHLDNGKARKLLGWTPAHTLQAGLQKTLDWYRHHGHG